MDDIIEGVEGIVDDMAQPDPTPEPKDNTQEIVSGLQDQIALLTEQVKTNQQQKNEVVDRFSKAVGFIEGANVGRYDPTTGEIIRIEQKPIGPDPIDELKGAIQSAEAALMKEFKEGEITQAEYYERKEKEVGPLKENLKDMQWDRKLNDTVEKLTPKKGTEAPTPGETADVSVKKQAYDNLAESYPDITASDTPLFKKMDELYTKDPELYGNANYEDGKGNPKQMQALIERAELELKVEGIEVTKAKNATRNKFATPGNKGYVPPVKQESNLTKEDIGNLVSQGISSKSLLSEINNAMGSWQNTNSIELED